ncbi:MAG: DUF2461 family protein, partial [Rhodobacteraceae bacterium]|nr:DUF2461 family protein [Paracoccaceae bacterium]
STGADFSDFGAPPLKRVPKPYAPEHPHGELLKRKSLTITAPLPTNWQNDGLVPSILTVAKALEPVRAWLADG